MKGETNGWSPMFEQLEPRVVLSHLGLDTVLYYPEGFATARTEEIVTLQNTAGERTEFELFARYEHGRPAGELIAQGELAPSERREIVLTRAGTLRGTLVRPFTPYALELRADGDLGAALTRRDFGAVAVEEFANVTAPAWSFPTVIKDADDARDFITVFNPGDEAVEVRLQVFDEGGVVTAIERRVQAGRRSGFAINGIRAIPEGRLGARIAASAPVVAALSHFDLDNGRSAVMNLGTPAGAVQTAAPVGTGLGEFDERGTGQRSLGILNLGATGGRVDLTVLTQPSTPGGAVRQIQRTLLVGPNARTEVAELFLGLQPGEQITSVEFDSLLPVVVGGESIMAPLNIGAPAGALTDGAGTTVTGSISRQDFGATFGTGPGFNLGNAVGSLGGANLSFGNPLGPMGFGRIAGADTLGTTTGTLGTATGAPGAGTLGTTFGTAAAGGASLGVADGSILGRTNTLLGRSETRLGRSETRLGAAGTSGGLGTGALGTMLTTIGGTTLTGTNGFGASGETLLGRSGTLLNRT